MSITFQQLQALLQQQQAQLDQTQLKLMQAMNQWMTLNPEAGNKNSTSAETVLGSVGEFLFDPMSGLTFNSWYKKYEDIFIIELTHLDDAQRVV